MKNEMSGRRDVGTDSERLGGAKPAPWATLVRRWTNSLVYEFGGVSRPWKFAWVINFHKLATVPFLALLIVLYHNTTAAAWIYLAMQGTYSIVWIIKDLAFPDPAWQRRVGVGGAVNGFIFVLGWYWVFGWLLISGVFRPTYPLPQNAWFCLCVSLCIAGCSIMIAARRTEIFHPTAQTWPYYGWHVSLHPASQLPRRNDDLRQLCAHGMALAANRDSSLDLGRPICGEHGAHRDKPVSLSAMDEV